MRLASEVIAVGPQASRSSFVELLADQAMARIQAALRQIGLAGTASSVVCEPLLVSAAPQMQLRPTPRGPNGQFCSVRHASFVECIGQHVKTRPQLRKLQNVTLHAMCESTRVQKSSLFQIIKFSLQTAEFTCVWIYRKTAWKSLAEPGMLHWSGVCIEEPTSGSGPMPTGRDVPNSESWWAWYLFLRA